MNDPREDILALVEDGMIDKDYLILSLLNWMSHEDVRTMAHMNEIPLSYEEFEDQDC